jgi:hypothetical protein
MSMPQPSTSKVCVPSPVIPSTTSSVPVPFTSPATASTLWLTAVEVSEACMKTALCSGFSAFFTSAKSKVCP